MYIQSLSATLAVNAHAASDSLQPNPPPIAVDHLGPQPPPIAVDSLPPMPPPIAVDSLMPNPPPIVPNTAAAPALNPESKGQLQGIIIVGGKEQGPAPPPIVPTATRELDPQAWAMRHGIIIIGGHPAELHPAVAQQRQFAD